MSQSEETTPESESEPDPDVESMLDKVDLVRIEDIYPYVNNPKEHPDHQIEKIASSIKNYGFDQFIVIDDDGEIIKGHGRLQAAKRLDMDRVPVIHRDDLNGSEVKAARIADNKTALESGWNMDALAVNFEELQDDPTIDVDELTGFDDTEIDAILEQQDFDIDEFFEEDVSEDDDGGVDEDSDSGPPPGEVECPDCGHHFAPTMDDMGEDTDPDEVEGLDDSAEPIDTARS